jgi:hypothetical protein
VKPIHLNLAARPYRDYKPVYAVVVVLSLVMFYLMLENVETYIRYKRDTRSTVEKIAKIEAETQQERAREQMVQQRMSSIDLPRLDAQTKFINSKLAQRAFSWSTLLDELESVLADDVRLLSVNPTFTEAGRIALNLSFMSKSADGMITTINQMNGDPQFQNTFPGNETVIEGGEHQFTLTAEYLPPTAQPVAKVVNR